ncbi:FUSC family protein [Pseudokineococcus basanitobsidens]|uniref:FUSC family protein n=1 Tax=Pseudokineococcus basanitobsidens TaxID=1926649 RepID=A0ABU8RKF9_9ACTN
MDVRGQARRAGETLRRPRHVARELGIGRFPRLEMAVKAALAATIAWQVAQLLPVPAAEQYPYYAPLGAVVAAYPSVRSSVGESVRSVLGVIAGAVLALGAEALLPAQGVLVPVVVGVGVLVAGFRVFGDQRSWVPIAALFVLVVGTQDPLVYVTAYSGLTLLGAAVSVLLTMLLPTVPLSQSTRAMVRLATTLADQLDDLADGLTSADPPTSSQWRARSQAIDPVLASVRASGLDVRRSLRANARAHRERGVVDRQRGEALVLDAVATRTSDLTDLLLDVHVPGRTELDLAEPLREPTARALRAAAAVVRPLAQESRPRPDEVTTMRHAVQHLSQVLAEQDLPGARSREAAGAVVTGLRRLLGALVGASEDQRRREQEDADALRPST